MRTRLMGFADYGFLPGEGERLREFCRMPDFAECFLLIESAKKANADICNDLYYSLVEGVSYDKLEFVKKVLIARNDFYAYQRKTLAIFKAALCEVGRYPDKVLRG